MITLLAQGVLVLSFVPPSAHPEGLELPPIFSDHMVLQHSASAPLWGRAVPGARVQVSVSWGAGDVETLADVASGAFQVELATPPAGGPHTITVRSSGQQVVLDDVLLGEVWLASGQSNMEWKLAQSDSLDAERSGGVPSRIRFFDVPNVASAVPLEHAGGTWRSATPESIAACSGVGWHFARRLEQVLDVPVGLVMAEWGGSRAEAWMSRATAGSFEALEPGLTVVEQSAAGGGLDLAQQRARFWARVDALDPEAAAQAACDDSAWEALAVPDAWGGELASFDGVVWCRRTVEIPAAWAGRELELSLGPIDDMDHVWFAGQPIGGLDDGSSWQTPRHYAIPAELVEPGARSIAVRILDTGGQGGVLAAAESLWIAPPEAPVEQRITLVGDWRHARGAAMQELGPWPQASLDKDLPTVIHQGMIQPLARFALAGVIWYQGESNRYDGRLYRELFSALILDWRRVFDAPELPFYFVQIAPFAYGGDQGQTGLVRDAQRRALALPMTGMAVTLDCGNPADIHPRDKRTVGERLARLALAGTYGRQLIASGPLYRACTIEGSAARVVFESSAGVQAVGRELAGFEIAGADGVFVAAQASFDGDDVLVSSPSVPRPVHVRYAWDAVPAWSLVNSAGLPASPFTSEP